MRFSENRFDVFICYNSIDLKYAEKVYKFLKQNGFQPFLSKHAVPNSGSSEYQKVIDEALADAEHLVIVAAFDRCLESDWVEAEWRMFINEKRAGRKSGNVVTVLFSNMQIEQLPISLRSFEVIAWNEKNKFNLLKYLGKAKSQPPHPPRSLKPIIFGLIGLLTVAVVLAFTLSNKRKPPPSNVLVNVADTFNPTGFMGDWGDVTLDDNWTENPYSDQTCIKITYTAARSQQQGWVGIYWQYPDNNWGDNPKGRDLTGATRLTFWARGENGNERAEFKAGGITGKHPDSIQPPASTGVITLSNDWRQYAIDLSGRDLSHVVGGFVWATNASQNPNGSTIYLDDIRYEYE